MLGVEAGHERHWGQLFLRLPAPSSPTRAAIPKGECALVDVCVAGFIYFELGVPRDAAWPEPGTEIFVDALPLRLGGALNTASVVRALGHPACVACPRGEGPGDLAARETLRSLGIEDEPWPARDDPAVSVVFSSTEDRAFLSAADAGALSRCPPLPAARWVHVPGLLEAEALAPRLAQARSQGSLVSVAGSWSPRHLAQLRHPRETPWDLLVLNDAEAKEVAPSLEQAMDLLRQAATNVVITRGARGAMGLLHGCEVEVEAVPVDAVDFTGAGDAFCGGLLAGLVRSLPAADALQLAVNCASRILTQRGGVARPALLREFVR